MIKINLTRNTFSVVMKEKCKEIDMETHFKDAFRAFSKDKEGLSDDCIVFTDMIIDQIDHTNNSHIHQAVFLQMN